MKHDRKIEEITNNKIEQITRKKLMWEKQLNKTQTKQLKQEWKNIFSLVSTIYEQNIQNHDH